MRNANGYKTYRTMKQKTPFLLSKVLDNAIIEDERRHSKDF
jgi:hypothetical protein